VTGNNHLEDMEPFVYTVIKNATYHAYVEKNMTEAEAKAYVEDKVNETYMVPARNFAESYRIWAEHLTYLNTTGDAEGIAILGQTQTNGEDAFRTGYSFVYGKDQYNIHWPNGTVGRGFYDVGDKATVSLMEPAERTDECGTSDYCDILTRGPNGTTTTILDVSKAYSFWDSIHAERDRMANQSATFVSDVYANWNRSELENNSTEFFDAITLATQFNTNENTTGYNGWTAAEMGLYGINGTANRTFTIDYTPDGDGDGYEPNETVRLYGSLFTNWQPNATNGSYVNGSTYNTTNAAPGLVFFTAQFNDSSQMVRLDGEFTIRELRSGKTGETLNETTLEEDNRQTLNYTSFIEEMERMQDYRENITVAVEGESEEEPTGFDFGGLSPMGAGVGGLAALVLVVVVANQLGSRS